MATAYPLLVSREVDITKAVDVVSESDLNKRIFRALVEYYQHERDYRPPKREEPKYPEGLSEEDKADLAYGRFMRGGMENSIRAIGFSFKPLEEMSKLVGESNLGELEKSLESFSDINLIAIGRYGKNKYYAKPSTHPYHLKDSGEGIDFYGYVDKIIGRLK